MRGRDAFAIVILVSVLIYSANAQYWFQFGATGDQVMVSPYAYYGMRVVLVVVRYRMAGSYRTG